MVLEFLIRNGVPAVGAVLPGKTPAGGNNADYRKFDFTDETTWAPALAGVTKLFLMRPPQLSNIKRDMEPFLRYVKTLEVKQTAFLSVQRAEENKRIPHYKIEQTLIGLEIPYTFVRPSFFMQNLTTTHLPEIRDEHRLFLPAGNGETNFIDVYDLAEFVSKILTEDGHLGRAYTITGGENLTYGEVAEKLSRTLHGNYVYQNAKPFEFIRYHRKQGRKLMHCIVMLALYSITKRGKAAKKTDTITTVLGRKPRTVEQFIEENKEKFLGSR
jgi:uncharacterized protein YbjT (DUF2867 family)